MIRTHQTNLTGGVISADSQDRLDLAVWRNGAKRLENVNIRPQGGVERRPGFAYVANADPSVASGCQVESFVFSAGQQYVFVFRNGAVDIYNKNSRAFVQTLGTAWGSAILAANELELSQSFDTMLGFHQTVQPYLIQRQTSGFFSLAVLGYSNYWDGTQTAPRPPMHRYEPGYVSMWTDVILGPAGGVNLYTSHNVFQAGHAGTYFMLRGVIIGINSVISPTQASVNIAKSLPDTNPSTDWQEQAFSPVRGWPRCGCLHEQRLWLGGGRDLPATLFASTTYDPFNFWLGTGAGTDAIKYTAAADRVAEIRRMVSFATLQVYTADGEFYAPDTQSEALTPSNFSLHQASAYGIGSAPPARFDQTTVFLSRAFGALREFVYDINQANFTADAITFMAGDVIRSPKDLNVSMEASYAQQAQGFITNADGTLAVLTKVRKENVGGWGLWQVSGSTVVAAGVVQRELWAVVNTAGIWRLVVADTNYRLDLAKGATSGSPQTVWPALAPHLANQTVQALAGDLYLGEVTVAADGTVTIPIPVTNLQVGLPFVPLIEPLIPEVQLADGTTWGQPKRVCSTTMSVLNTIAAQIEDDLMPTDNLAGDPGIAPDRFTGTFKSWHLGWDPGESPLITQQYPLPFTLRSLSLELEI